MALYLGLLISLRDDAAAGGAELHSPRDVRGEHNGFGMLPDETDLEMAVYSTRHYVLKRDVRDGEHRAQDGRN